MSLLERTRLRNQISNENNRITHITRTQSNMGSEANTQAISVNRAIDDVVNTLRRGLGCQTLIGRINATFQNGRETTHNHDLGNADSAMQREINAGHQRISQLQDQLNRL